MPEFDDLLDRAAAGDRQATAELLRSQHAWLVSFVAGRLDERLTARCDPADVVQDVLLEASCRLDMYLRVRSPDFRSWVRKIAVDRVNEIHRDHIHAGKRSVNREAAAAVADPSDSSGRAALEPPARGSSPSSHVHRRDLQQQLRDLLGELPERYQRILILRFFELKSAREVGEILGLSEDAVQKAQLRALKRLRDRLDDTFGEGLP